MWKGRTMMIIFYILLMLKSGRCTEDQSFETKTVGVGQHVTLTCTRDRLGFYQNFFWIRLISGTFPEVLGGTIAADFGVAVETHRITAKQGPGTFDLHITETQMSDTAVYYCVKVERSDMMFSKGVFLRVKGYEPDITAVIQDFPPDPVSPGDLVTLQCSVLSEPEKKTCPEENLVYWFRARSDEFHPSLIYAQRNNSDGCEKSPEAGSPQKCVYSFSKNISSSDAGTYYCAVASCGEIFYGNGTKLEIEAVNTCDPQTKNTVLFLMCAALAIGLVVIVFLVYAMREKCCDRSKAAVTLQTNAAAASGNQQRQQRNEDSLVYVTPNFNRKKAGKRGRRNQRKDETIYTDVRDFVID